MAIWHPMVSNSFSARIREEAVHGVCPLQPHLSLGWSLHFGAHLGVSQIGNNMLFAFWLPFNCQPDRVHHFAKLPFGFRHPRAQIKEPVPSAVVLVQTAFYFRSKAILQKVRNKQVCLLLGTLCRLALKGRQRQTNPFPGAQKVTHHVKCHAK